MSFDGAIAIVSALFCAGLAIGVLFKKGAGLPERIFSIGMILLAVENFCEVMSSLSISATSLASWQSWAAVVKSCVPGVWIAFSASYSRGDGRNFLRKWKWLLLGATILPFLFALSFHADLVELNQVSPGDFWIHLPLPGKILNGYLLLGAAIVLMNLEQTSRAAVGTTRWRIKFLILGVAVIFGVRIYTRSQGLLFSGHDLRLLGFEAMGALLGCVLIFIGFLRSGFKDLDLYPSRSVLHTSLTILFVGGYLLIVGLLAQVASYLGTDFSFRFAGLIILLGAICLALILLSEKARRRLDLFVSRNLRRPRYDFRALWAQFTEATAEIHDPIALAQAVARLLSETFHALSVSVWLLDEQTGELKVVASTSGQMGQAQNPPGPSREKPDASLLQTLSAPVDLDTIADEKVARLRILVRKQFREGGHQICVPLRVRDHCYGVALLSDRVRGMQYTTEEFDLLGCLADQTAARLMNLQISSQLIARKELEALQTVTAFFVHDLKNAASTLNLMLTNLPVHFADPAFREDAMRGIRQTIGRIDQLISRAGSLRAEFELHPSQCDLNSLVTESLKSMNGHVELEWVPKLHPLPPVMADPERIQSVITNLLLNASEASGTSRVTIETGQVEHWASLEVADNGCGMTPSFVKDSLFRPFRSTKKKGMGIGMFQARLIVEAHRGKMSVRSEPGVGTTFRVLLPI
jgi:putative PEP-CTERM system histidine kinase